MKNAVLLDLTGVTGAQTRSEFNVPRGVQGFRVHCNASVAGTLSVQKKRTNSDPAVWDELERGNITLAAGESVDPIFEGGSGEYGIVVTLDSSGDVYADFTEVGNK